MPNSRLDSLMCLYGCVTSKSSGHVERNTMVTLQVVEKTLSSIRELFPGSSLLQMMRYICKANNDEGHVIVRTKN